jgi:hypothetical protein
MSAWLHAFDGPSGNLRPSVGDPGRQKVSYAHSMLSDIDLYRDEYQLFLWDVNILIINALRAGIQYLAGGAQTELAKIDEWMNKPASDEYQEHLVDERVDVLETNRMQERFLRNMSLVALSSRLTHSLRKMAKSAEVFSPRKKRYGKHEYERIPETLG